MNILPKLSLNKHPKDCDNLSLVNAFNIKISNDESCITNEESIVENKCIKEHLNNTYGENSYRIIGIIPCNEELVIIVNTDSDKNNAEIFRYHEKDINDKEYIYKVYGDKEKLSYHGGKIKGAFTYNVEGSLIIAIAEYDCHEKVPLRTINLGKFNDSSIYNDTELPDKLLAASPEVNIPSVYNVNYVAGSAYKGWYYLFIRYKINNTDYTQWYNFGFPIYIDTIEQFQIIKYCYNRDTHLEASADPYTYNKLIYPNKPAEGYGAGCSDYFSNKQNIAKESFKIDINNIDNNFKKYQIGIVCASKSYLKAFRTSDINYVNPYADYTFNSKNVITASTEEFIIDNYNYFNVKNIINYKNRLYISNYLENNLNDNILDDVINKINTKLHKSYIEDKGLVYDQCMFKDGNNSNQYDVYKWPRIPFTTYLGVNKDIKIKVEIKGLSAKTIIDDADKFFFSCANENGKERNYGNLIIGHFKLGALGLYNIEWVVATLIDPYYYITNIEDSNFQPIKLSIYEYALQSGRKYINTNKGFNNRKLKSTLIPGEVYNFFIHFVDKYGHSTNGYRIINNNKCITSDDRNTEIIPIKFKVNINDEIKDVYAALPIDSDVLNYDNKLNIENIKFYNTRNNYKLNDKVTDIELIKQYTNSFINLYNSFELDKYTNYKWYQIVTNYDESDFDIFINNNNERLFKIPFNKSFIKRINIDYNDTDIKDFTMIHSIYNVSFDNITIPEGYVGYFISYEKYEPIQRVTGLLTRNDFRSQDDIVINDEHFLLPTANNIKSNNIMFYSSSFDISDSIKLDYNILRIEGVDVFNKEDIPEYDYMQRNNAFSFMHDMNKPQIESFAYDRIYAMPDYKIAVADSSIDNRMGLGTCLQIQDKYNLFPVYKPSKLDTNNKIKLYRATLLNANRNIYMSNNKTLIRLTDIYYNTNRTGIIRNGLPGHVSYDGVLIYENAGTLFNDADNKVRQFNYNTEYYKSEVPKETPHTYQNDIPFVSYVQFPIYSDIFFESKSYKNDPKGIVYFTYHDEKDAKNNKFWSGSMVTPANSIDLFENRQSSSDTFNVKTYTNYRKDLVSVDKFDKTVRRSNVIQDESRINRWRNFPVEGYKNIAENKGNITNLIGIGTMLLVHTEHSLFLFDTNNMLKTKDKDVQLLQPDSFDVAYKEVFTSDLGFGGLQDDKSYIIDQFGYIYYNNDFNRFYKFDAGQLVYIDDDIIQWLNRYKPYNVRFANDKYNTRLLIKMNYTIEDTEKVITLSYNYKAKNFVSLHSYYFNEAYNTKNKLYLQCDVKHKNCSLHNFIQDDTSYGQFDNIIEKVKTKTNVPSSISIIINNDYESIKFLNFINYKLYKYNGVNKDFTNLPVEETKQPFSGDTLEVFNDLINTGKLDISVTKEELKNVFGCYDKPYWELGNWNFSYLRNNIAKIADNISATEMSRIYGNYIIVKFTFNNEDNNKVELESINYNVSK